LSGISPAMRPVSVFAPVATTSPTPCPPTTIVPAKAMLRRTASGVSCGSGLGRFPTGNASPVSIASTIPMTHICTT
jgi:hypothetical protein